jgi:hypothetical protein
MKFRAILGSQLESWEPETGAIGFPTGKLGTRGGGWGWVPNWKVGNQHGKSFFLTQQDRKTFLTAKNNPFFTSPNLLSHNHLLYP